MPRNAPKRITTNSGEPVSKSSPESDSAVPVDQPEATAQFDLQAAIVEIDLERLVLNLENVPSSTLEEDSPAPQPHASPVSGEGAAPVERRRAARLTTSELGDNVQVSLPRAARTGLVNVSDSGALVDTNCQLFPGRTTDVFVKLRGERIALRATVVRCSLHALTSDGLVYRSALQFERIISLGDSLSR